MLEFRWKEVLTNLAQSVQKPVCHSGGYVLVIHVSHLELSKSSDWLFSQKWDFPIIDQEGKVGK